MDVRDAIAKQVEGLPREMREQALRLVTALTGAEPVGESGAMLREFSSYLDSDSARQMTEAIEEECERIDAGEW